jgi:hypothetical protein
MGPSSEIEMIKDDESFKFGTEIEIKDDRDCSAIPPF